MRGVTWRHAYSHAFTAEQLDSISEVVDADRWSRFLEAPPPRTAAFVATRGDEVVGFASLGPARPGDDPSLGELFTIYVLPDQWGAGIGQELMATVLEHMHGDGFVDAILWVLADNPRTHRFYERSGWIADGQVKEEDWLGSTIREVRFRTSLRPD